MFSFHTDNAAYATHFSVQRNLLKGEKREKNDFKGNVLKKVTLVCLGLGFFLLV